MRQLPSIGDGVFVLHSGEERDNWVPAQIISESTEEGLFQVETNQGELMIADGIRLSIDSQMASSAATTAATAATTAAATATPVAAEQTMVDDQSVGDGKWVVELQSHGLSLKGKQKRCPEENNNHLIMPLNKFSTQSYYRTK